MTKIKICGLKREEDIQYVNEVKPDYVGFVFANSKRRVTLDKAKELIALLDNSIKTIGVFVDEEIEKALEFGEKLNLHGFQFHGNEGAEYIKNFQNFTVWKAMSIKVDLENGAYEIDKYKEQLNRYKDYSIESIVLDSSVKGAEGGTGVSFDWEVVPKLNISKKLILAGGLNISNVQEAIKMVKPYAVDVSSGVETNGVKDYNKIKKFVEKVRNILWMEDLESSVDNTHQKL